MTRDSASGARGRYRAALLDLDGVLTRTATQHARAWKEMFDRFLEQRAAREGREDEDYAPFDIGRDYLRHVDGKPRFDGLRSFLQSRGIDLPEGSLEDSAEDETIRGLGRRKNDLFLELLDREKVEVFDDAVDQLHRWRDEGLATALITSSRNGRRILRSAGLTELFDIIVDGADAAELRLRGKPAPDTFLHAARELGVDPGDAIFVEDAIAGVQAGRAGAFGLVVGVARDGAEDLREAGADVVVRDLRELREVDDAERADSGHRADRAAADHADRAHQARNPRRSPGRPAGGDRS